MSDQLAEREPAYRVPRAGRMDPATKRLAVIAAGLGGALFVVVGAWSTLGGEHSGPVPVIAPPAGPLRVRPDNPGGLKVANDTILSGRLSDAGGDKLAPGPEAPDPQGLTEPPAPAEPAAPMLRTETAPVAGTPAQSAPGQNAMGAPAHPPVARAEPPVAAAHAAPVPAPPPVKAAAVSAGAAHGAQVQLAAVPTRQEAEAAWRTLAHRDALGGHAPSFSQVQVNGKTWWRIRTGGFADEAQARGFCEKLRADGGTCSVARF